MSKKILVEVSARHIHISRKDLDILFGEGFSLTKIKDLSQLGEFAAKETVSIISKNGKVIDNVRILGPEREKTQVEISLTDSYFLKENVPLKQSGDLLDSAPVKLSGPEGEVYLNSGMIVAKRHFHCTKETAKELNIEDNSYVMVKIEGERGLIFDNVLVRITNNAVDRIHLDTDEGNACAIKGDVFGEIIIN
ncbi:phosphate propanoyltransferase [Patescibacteria group bacterium]|nr:phosphate propanoyltransferase [Patescibacteria group bacterium]